MAPNPLQSPPQSAIEKLIEKSKTRALSRGTKSATWNDLWITMALLPDFSEIFGAQNIDAHTFASEIAYIEKFAGDLLVPPPLDKAEVKAATEALLKDLEELKEAGFGIHHANKDVMAQVVDIFHHKLLTQVVEGPDLEAAKRDILIKGMILQNVISNTLHGLEARDPKVGPILDALEAGVTALLSRKLITRDFDMQAEIDPIKSIESALMQGGPGYALPSALEIFEAVRNVSGEAYEDLMYRNGLRSDTPNRHDTFRNDLPEAPVSALMMRALKMAYDENAPSLDSSHILFALLQKPEVMRHLSKVGIKKLDDFEEKIEKALRPKEEQKARKKKVSIHPTVPPSMTMMVELLNLSYLEHERMEELFLQVIQTTPPLMKAVTDAGLTATMQKSWQKKYDKKDKETKPEKSKKPAEKKISDEELDALIEEYCVDFTALAKKKKFDPMIGNKGLVEQMSTILLKRGKKNPVVIGEPGIGKTKALEGMAQAIVSGDVPKKLVGSRLIMLDLHAMNDSPYVGIFESRIKPLLTGISQRNAEGKKPPILLGIDEFAEAQNAGGHSHSPGFKGMVKPYLTTGDIFMLGATTLDEYRSKVEKDAALARRLQPVMMTTPTDAETAEILKGLKSKYEEHHGVTISAQMVKFVAENAGRYIHTVNQPDKSIDLMDEAMANAQQSGSATLKKDHVLKVISGKTNIPYSYLAEDDKARYVNLEEKLTGRVLGQDDAVKAAAAAIKRAKAGFKDPKAPIGNFLFVGPTGVGKTELTKAIAEYVMGSETDFLVRYDMSEFAEKHSIARFIGAPAGYVGYDEGGGLVKDVRSKPFAVYLYDEVEKAHRDVFNVLLAPFSDGVVTDGRGISADMRYTVNILTSNIGAEAVMEMGRELGLDPVEDHEAWQKMAKPIYQQAVEKFFRPEFLNRLDGIIYFDSLRPETIELLVNRQMEQTKRQLKDNHGLELELSPAFKNAAAKSGFDVRYGARPLKRAWKDHVETPLANWLLSRTQPVEEASTIVMTVANENATEPAFQVRKPAGIKP